MQRIKQETDEIYAPFFLGGGGMIFDRTVDVEVDVVLTLDGLGVIEEKQIGTHGWVGSWIDGDGTTFEGCQELGGEMTGCGVSHPDVLGEELGEHKGRGFGFHDADGHVVGIDAVVNKEMKAE